MRSIVADVPVDHVFECNEIETLFQRFAHLRSLVCPLLGGCQSGSALTTVILPSKDFQWKRGRTPVLFPFSSPSNCLHLQLIDKDFVSRGKSVISLEIQTPIRMMHQFDHPKYSI